MNHHLNFGGTQALRYIILCLA